MKRYITLLSALMLSLAAADIFQAVGDVAEGFASEASAIASPIAKVASSVVFSQCKGVKELLRVDYDHIQDDRNLTQMTVDFFTSVVREKYYLTELSLIASSKWFKPKERLVIYFHGFTDNPDKDSSRTLISTFLYKGIGNVLVLDASPLIGYLYLRSSTLVRYIGEAVGKALTNMMIAGLDPSAVHLIGHSLGSHIAGFAGKTVLALSGSRVGRISGLDPAGPCFGDVHQTLRLNKNDALFVDVIHTDAGVFGLDEAIGHADYYPNGGSEQPGCLFQTCSHGRAWIYYAESVIHPVGFPAVRCADWKGFQSGNCDYRHYSLMGYGSERGAVGRYYLLTADKPPFALGIKSVKYTGRDGILRTIRDFLGF